jgi:DNA primase
LQKIILRVTRAEFCFTCYSKKFAIVPRNNFTLPKLFKVFKKRIFMRFSEEFISEVTEKNDIVSVISGYVKLKRMGSGYLGLCPFHSEKTPSFSVTPAKGLFYCFGCQAGGSVIQFIMKQENLNFIDSVKFLADRAGIELPKESYKTQPGEVSTYEKKQTIYGINRAAAEFFNKNLFSSSGSSALKYLLSRGLTNDIIEKFCLGYSLNDNFKLLNHLTKLGFNFDDIDAAGLIVKKTSEDTLYDTGLAYFDKFRNRVMFPIFDVRQNIIGFGGRIMDTNKNAPKYLNTADTLAFKKGNNLFALNIAKKNNGSIILVEGYMDAITLHKAGFSNAAAGLGTALTEGQARLIKNYATNVYLCYDSDNAGQAATDKAAEILSKFDIKLKVIKVTGAKDADEYINKFGAESFKTFIIGAKSYIDHKIENLKLKYNLEDIEERASFLSDVAEVLANIKSKVKLEMYVNKIACEFNVSQKSIMAEISEKLKNSHEFLPPKKNEEISEVKPLSGKKLQIFSAERLLVLLMFTRENFNIISKELTADDFTDGLHKKLANAMYDFYKNPANQDKTLSINDILLHFSEAEVGEVSKILIGKPGIDCEKKNKMWIPIKIIKEHALKARLKIFAANSDKENLMITLNELKRVSKLASQGEVDA